MMIPHDGGTQPSASAPQINIPSLTDGGLHNTSLDRIATALETLCKNLEGRETVNKKKSLKKSMIEGGFLGLRAAK